MRNDLRQMIDDILPTGELVRRGYLKPAFIRRMIENDRVGKADHSKELWHFLTMDYWLRNQADIGADRSIMAAQ